MQINLLFHSLIRTFAEPINTDKLMKGIIIIIAGALMLAATRFGSLSSHNWLLVTGLLLIVTGIVLYIRHIKHESNY